jgi:hypothetical protein
MSIVKISFLASSCHGFAVFATFGNAGDSGLFLDHTRDDRIAAHMFP